MMLFRRKTTTDEWEKAPLICLKQQEGGWLYRYFENEGAASRNSGFR